MKHGVVRALAGEHPVRRPCRVFGVARSAYYTAPRKAERLRAQDNVRLEEKARELLRRAGAPGQSTPDRGVASRGRTMWPPQGARLNEESIAGWHHALR